MPIDAVLLTGGASRRMGTDKAALEINGEAMAQRIARELASVCDRVTVLGRSPIPPYEFLADEERFSGPLTALGRYVCRAECVFLASCDLPLFDGGFVRYCASVLGHHDAALPVVQGKWQPLCGLYRASALAKIDSLVQQGKRNLMAWVDQLDVAVVHPEDLEREGLDRRCVMSANSMAELSELLEQETIL